MISNYEITKCAHISRRKFDTILDCFIADTTAIQASKIARVNYNTAKKYFVKIREIIIKSALLERKEARLHNGIEIDESYFGPNRVRGKRGRGAGKKIIVLGLLKRNGKVYTEIIDRAKMFEIMPIIHKVVKSGSDIFTDGWKSYDAVAAYGYNHKKVIHEKDEFAREDGSHINGVESYWSWTKRRFAKFNGLTRIQFSQYLLESEWRFNHRKNLRVDLRKMLHIF